MNENEIDLTVSETISNEDRLEIALDFTSEGGSLRRLPEIPGLTDERWKRYREWLRSTGELRYPDRRFPILFPETSPTSYISFERALNLKLAGEPTGDWHFEVSFFGYPEPTFAPLAGRNGLVNTNISLGSRGVRDMGRLIAEHGIKRYDGPVWVANHYRAIADITVHHMQGERYWEPPTACEINDRLWSEEDIDILVEDYLKPLRRQMRGSRKVVYEEWLPTVVYDVDYDDSPPDSESFSFKAPLGRWDGPNASNFKYRQRHW